MMAADPYTTLGVPRDATTEQVKRAYRKKAPKVHPDTSRHKDGKEFCALQKAYSILSDAERRARFDARSRGAGYAVRFRLPAATPH